MDGDRTATARVPLAQRGCRRRADDRAGESRPPVVREALLSAGGIGVAHAADTASQSARVSTWPNQKRPPGLSCSTLTQGTGESVWSQRSRA